MTNRPLFALLTLAFLALPVRAGEVEVKVTGVDAAPKALGTISTPIRVMQTGTEGIPQLPAGVDVRTYDGPMGELQIPVEALRSGLVVPGAPVTGGQLAAPDAGLTSASNGASFETLETNPDGAAAEGEHPGPKAELSQAAPTGAETRSDAPAEELSGRQDTVFDGKHADAISYPDVATTRLGRIWRSATQALSRRAERAKARKAEAPVTKDAYGGPLKLDLDLKGKTLYGIKWGLNMLGLGALIQVAAKVGAFLIPWQLLVPDSILQSAGRAELLARLGPKAIDTALVHAPWHFLFVQLPSATFWEEVGQLPFMLTSTGFRGLELGVLWLLIKGARTAAGKISKLIEKLPDTAHLRSAVQAVLTYLSTVSNKKVFYAAAALTVASLFAPPLHIALTPLAFSAIGSRLFGFGLLWSVLAAVKPITAALAKWSNAIPDLFGLRGGEQAVLERIGRISNKAFPIAAVISALAFAANHFGAWGVSPYLIALQTTMGGALAYVGYKTRSVYVPFVAHYTFNLLTLGAGLLAAHFLLPMAAQMYTITLSLASVAFLYYNYRSNKKARAHETAQRKADLMARAGKAVLPVLLLALMAGSMVGPGYVGNNSNQAAATKAALVWPVQNAAPQAAPQQEKPATPAAPDTTKPADPNAPKVVKVSLSQALDIMTISATAKAKPSVIKIFSGNGLGSGYIVSPDGIAISNAHVTGEARVGDVLKMEFADGSPGEIKVLAFNHNKDIAILQLPKKDGGWPFLPLGDNKTLNEGESVIAMGYPLGLPFTATYGKVSGLGMGRGSIYVEQLQTDAPINHGNSGGPLINMNGEVIGMNTAIASPTPESGSIGIGFSITADDIKAAIAQFKATGNINTSWIGIIVNESNPTAPDMGVLVELVRPGSPAAKAGINDGDLILGVDGHRFGKGPQGLETLARAIAQHKPGEKLSVLVASDGDVAPLTITLAEDPTTATTVAPPAPTDSGKAAPAAKPSLWGRFAGALSAVLRAIFSGLSSK